MTQTLNTEKPYDVIIVGGGMVGLAIAAGIQKQLIENELSLKIALIEPYSPSEPSADYSSVTDYDLRVSAISAQNQVFLMSLGAWDKIPAVSLSAYTEMKVWDNEGTGNVHFSAQDIHQPCLGHIVENRHTVWSLMQTIQERQAECRIEFIEEKVSHIDNQTGDGLTPLFLSNGEQLQTQLLVAADGALSRIKQWIEVGAREWDYGHAAIVASIKTEKTNEQTAWQVFRQNGPLALLPFADEQLSSIVWSTVAEEAEELLKLSDAEFCEALSKASEFKLGNVVEVSRRASFPLRQRHAIDYAVEGVVLAGDAAHTIHPLAGQGVNLGFKDAAVLVEEIIRAQQKRIPLGDMAVLSRYQRRRQADNLTMMAAMEGFKRLFAAESPWLRLIRNQGMNAFNKSSLVKNHIIHHALGIK